MEFLARLEETLECLSKKDCTVIISGDFNINISKNLTAAYFDIINSNGFELLNSDTNINSVDSCIDHFITKNVEGKIETHKGERFQITIQFPLKLSPNIAMQS